MFKDNPAILAALEPGDRIVATMRAVERSRQVMAMTVALLLVVVWGAAIALTHANSAVVVPSFIAASAVNVVLWSRQKPYFIAITGRLFICHGVTLLRGRPTRLLFTAPLSAVSLTVGRTTWLMGTAVRYQGPGVPSQGLSLMVGSRSGEYLGSVVAALRAGGASVAP